MSNAGLENRRAHVRTCIPVCVMPTRTHVVPAINVLPGHLNTFFSCDFDKGSPFQCINGIFCSCFACMCGWFSLRLLINLLLSSNVDLRIH